mmetsp:Transcript_1388/g.4162  ORF Transcript_1388/g.4162 Transcript_1388/m.4162 type:complete len:220 (-) Transcript_1388:249-908(-)
MAASRARIAATERSGATGRCPELSRCPSCRARSAHSSSGRRACSASSSSARSACGAAPGANVQARPGPAKRSRRSSAASTRCAASARARASSRGELPAAPGSGQPTCANAVRQIHGLWSTECNATSAPGAKPRRRPARAAPAALAPLPWPRADSASESPSSSTGPRNDKTISHARAAAPPLPGRRRPRTRGAHDSVTHTVRGPPPSPRVSRSPSPLRTT